VPRRDGAVAEQRSGWRRRISRPVLASLALAFGLALAAPASAGLVALTFDDLPVFGPFYTPAQGEDVTTRLLGGLKRNHLRAIGFVNEIQLDNNYRDSRIAILKQWLDAGMDLGNHSYSHLSLTRTAVDAYIGDVAKGETATKALLAARGRKESWYRYPYLETGTTVANRQTFEAWLTDHGYRVAPVSMENSDWEFAEPYADALARGDKTEAAHIRTAYLDFTARIVPWYRTAALQLLGREPAFVMLLHASRLNADSIDQLSKILSMNGLKSVSLEQAMQDPAYRIADTYVGPDGIEWLTRWSLTLHKDLPYSVLPRVPGDIAAYDAKVEAAPTVPPVAPSAAH
jgi:peptidoglycan/xylan/chitin deacetylase (PgdA/CDA1 family)